MSPSFVFLLLTLCPSRGQQSTRRSDAAKGAKAAIDSDDLAGNEARAFIAQQPEQRAEQIFRLAEAPLRGVRVDRVAARSQGTVGLGEQAAVLVGEEEAGGDGVDAPAGLREMHGQPLGEIAYARLGGAVGRDLCEGLEGGHPRDVD